MREQGTLVYLHNTAAEHFDKLAKEYQRLYQGMHKDDLDNFLKTAWHLIEIVEKDPKSTREQKKRVGKLRKNPSIILCGEIANKQKHFELKREGQIVESKQLDGFGAGRFGQGPFGEGEQSITFVLDNGTERNALELAEEIFKKWSDVFSLSPDPVATSR